MHPMHQKHPTAFAKPMLVSMHSTLEIYVHHQMPFIVPVFFRINRFDDVYVQNLQKTVNNGC